MIAPVEDRGLVSLLPVLAGRTSPHTAFEEWAAAAQQSPDGDIPPPADEARAVWELLKPQ